MSHPPIALQLKALRQRAGLSVRAMATLLRRPSSSYNHYESPERLKGDFLPMEIALQIAEVLEPRGIPRDEVMALAAPVEVHSAEPGGFAEAEAEPYAPRNPKGREEIEAVMRIVAPGVRSPVAYRLSRDHHGLALLEGDILVIDQARQAEHGCVVVATLADTSTGAASTVIRQYAGGMIVPPVGNRQRDAGLSAGILGVIVALVRMAGTY